MRAKSLVLFAILFALLLLVSGCVGTGGQTQAITDAIIAYSDYYIEVRNLSSQVKAQVSSQTTDSATQEYTILTDIPDYTSVDLSTVGFTLPEPTISLGSAAAYERQATVALRHALEQYAGTGAISSVIQIPVKFTVVKGDNQWTANLTSQSKLNIQDTVENLILGVLQENADYQSAYQTMQISAALAGLLADTFGGAEYTQLVQLDQLQKSVDGTYSATISYPDSEAVFSALGAAYAASFNQSFYGDELVADLSTDGIPDIDLSAAQMRRAEISLSYDAETKSGSLINDGGLKELIQTAKSAAEATVSAQINTQWRVAPLETPESGTILEGESTGNTIKFKTSAALGSYFYVRFYAISGDDATEEGTLQLGIFINGGKSAKFNLPSGYYRVSCLVGANWYGLDHLFGKDYKTYSGGNAIQSRDGYQNSVSFE